MSTSCKGFLAPPWRLSLPYNFYLFLSNPTFSYSFTNISFILSSFYCNITQYSFISCKINKYFKLNLGLLQKSAIMCLFHFFIFISYHTVPRCPAGASAPTAGHAQGALPRTRPWSKCSIDQARGNGVECWAVNVKYKIVKVNS